MRGKKHHLHSFNEGKLKNLNLGILIVWYAYILPKNKTPFASNLNLIFQFAYLQGGRGTLDCKLQWNPVVLFIG